MNNGTDLGLFGPDSVTWRIHGDPSSLLGGLRALLMQGLNPPAMAAVSQNSRFREDPWGRLQRTSEYVMVTTFGDTRSAQAAGARIRAIHKAISGVDPSTGVAYRADDPELLLWVHCVEVDSFLAAYRTYGGFVSNADADRYVREMVASAELVGLSSEEVPHDLSEIKDYFDSMTGLKLTPQAAEGLRVILNPPMPLLVRPLWVLAASSGIALLPPWVRKMYGIPWFPPVSPAVRAYTYALCRAMNIVLPGPPVLREARLRAAAAPA